MLPRLVQKNWWLKCGIWLLSTKPINRVMLIEKVTKWASVKACAWWAEKITTDRQRLTELVNGTVWHVDDLIDENDTSAKEAFRKQYTRRQIKRYCGWRRLSRFIKRELLRKNVLYIKRLERKAIIFIPFASERTGAGSLWTRKNCLNEDSYTFYQNDTPASDGALFFRKATFLKYEKLHWITLQILKSRLERLKLEGIVEDDNAEHHPTDHNGWRS